MVAMLMREENAGQLFRRQSGSEQASAQLLCAQSGVDKKCGRFVAHESGISLASARERDDLEHSTLMPARPGFRDKELQRPLRTGTI